MSVLLGFVLVAFVVAVAVFVIRVVGFIHQENFNARFPPISDEEFVALCTPGTDPDVALRVRRIIANCLAVEYDRVHPAMNFVEDIGAD